MYDIYKILEGIYEDEELRYTCIPLFIGNPGIAKTITINQFAESKKVNVIEVIGSTKLPNEISGVAMPDHDTKTMTYFDYDLFLNAKDGDIIFFDELLNTNPMVLNACLTILQNRCLPSGKPLAKVMIVAAANKQGATILTPQIKERFIFYDVEFREKEWAQYMYKKYNMIDACLDELILLIKSENFENSRVNYFSSRSVDKAVGMMIRGIDTPYEKSLKPLLSKYITNTTENIIHIGDFEWLPNERISWLDLARKQYKLSKTMINDKINTES